MIFNTVARYSVTGETFFNRNVTPIQLADILNRALKEGMLEGMDVTIKVRSTQA